MAKTNEKVLFEVDGFEVKSNSIYIIEDKKDGDAPSGFVKEGISKIPGYGVGESFQIPYHRTSATHGIWDTGFYEYSPCYSKLDAKERKVIVSSLEKNVVEPYRQAMGMPDLFKGGSNEDFTNIMFHAYSGKVINTNDPKAVVELYFALRSGTVSPENMTGASKYRGAYYKVVDRTVKKKKVDERNMLYFDAVGMFNTMFKSAKPDLIAVLAWVGIPNINEKIDRSTLVSIFMSHAEKNKALLELFIDTCEESTKESFKERLYIHQKLVKYKGTRLTRSTNGKYYFDDIEIGPDYKSAAENLSKDKDLAEVKGAILELK